ncbi:MAG: nucleotide exchange factor GrpE [Planctomycetota bacterium]
MKRKTEQPDEEPREAHTDEAHDAGETPGNLAIEREEHEGTDEEDELARLIRENAELKVQWARAQADYQNQKRRLQADYEAGVRRRLQPLFVDLLQVLDYLDMALATPATTPEAENLFLGVEMTRQQFLRALTQQGVNEVATEGKFDPNLHEASGAEVRDDVEPGTIVRVVRKGYRWNDELLRFAHVVVAKSEGDDAGDGPEITHEA